MIVGINPVLLVLGGVVLGLLVLAIAYLLVMHVRWRECCRCPCLSGERVFVRSQDKESSLLYGYLYSGCLMMDSSSLFIRKDSDELRFPRGSVDVAWGSDFPMLRALLPSIRIRGEGTTVTLAARDSIFDPDTYNKTKSLFEKLVVWAGEVQESRK